MVSKQADINLQSIVLQASRLVSQLERLSADSPYAHRARGIRGRILKSLIEMDENTGNNTIDGTESISEKLLSLMQIGSQILILAAKDIPPDS